MTPEIIELNKDVLGKLHELDKSKVYLFEVEVGNMPYHQVDYCLTNLRDMVTSTGIVGVFIPTVHGLNPIKITELEKYLEESK